jgi:hypothetical protein
MLAYAGYALRLGPEQSVAAYTQDAASQPSGGSQSEVRNDLTPARNAFYSGTVVRDSSGFELRGQSGELYHLDDPYKAEAFAGKSVKVTGKLDQAAKLIHVERIEEMRV